MADEQNRRTDRSYEDENLTEQEKRGHTRLPQPDEQDERQDDGTGRGDTMNPDRPDEFGDGDRRS